MDRVDKTIKATLTKKTSIQQVEVGTLLVSQTTRFPSYSHPDARESTTGNWLELQSVAPPVVKVSKTISFLAF